MTGLNLRDISYFYRKFGPVIYQTCTGWIRYPEAGHVENSIFRLVSLFNLLQSGFYIHSHSIFHTNQGLVRPSGSCPIVILTKGTPNDVT